VKTKNGFLSVDEDRYFKETPSSFKYKKEVKDYLIQNIKRNEDEIILILNEWKIVFEKFKLKKCDMLMNELLMDKNKLVEIFK